MGLMCQCKNALDSIQSRQGCAQSKGVLLLLLLLLFVLLRKIQAARFRKDIPKVAHQTTLSAGD